MKLDSYFTPYTTLTSVRFQCKTEIVKPLEENIEEKCHQDIGLSNNFMDMTPKTENRSKIKQEELHQTKKPSAQQGK